MAFRLNAIPTRIATIIVCLGDRNLTAKNAGMISVPVRGAMKMLMSSRVSSLSPTSRTAKPLYQP